MKNVLITGGSRGIGRACVEKFAREGYAVSFIYNNSDAAASELAAKTGAYPIKADISNPEAAKKAVETGGGPLKEPWCCRSGVGVTEESLSILRRF